jgi:hypothetical protein
MATLCIEFAWPWRPCKITFLQHDKKISHSRIIPILDNWRHYIRPSASCMQNLVIPLPPRNIFRKFLKLSPSHNMSLSRTRRVVMTGKKESLCGRDIHNSGSTEGLITTVEAPDVPRTRIKFMEHANESFNKDGDKENGFMVHILPMN